MQSMMRVVLKRGFSLPGWNLTEMAREAGKP